MAKPNRNKPHYIPTHSVSEPLGFSGVEYLVAPTTQQLLVDLADVGNDPLKLASRLSGTVSAQERRWLMDYLQLRPRLSEKFGLTTDLVCDRLAYEQSTAQDLGRWKAALWPAGSSVHDLCCGMGGDSFFIPPTVKVQGYDLDPARIAMYNHNMQVQGLPFCAQLQDVRNLESRAQFFCIDPARRAELGQNQRDWTLMTPALDEVMALAQRYEGGMIKLPPGFPLEAVPSEVECLFLGGRNDCRELLLLTGSLATQPGHIRALSLGESVLAWDGTQAQTNAQLPVSLPGRYLFEPRPVLVRSHLFVKQGTHLGLWQIDSGLAYLSGDELPDASFGLTAYTVLEHCPLSTGAVRAMLRHHDVGKLTLKKRGVEIVPEVEIKRLAPKGSRSAILFYTRIQGEKSAILALEPSVS